MLKSVTTEEGVIPLRTLIAMGRLDEAKTFVDSSSYKIPRDVKMRLEKAFSNGGKRYEPVEDIVEEAIEAPVVKNSIAKFMQLFEYAISYSEIK